jgi:hypothetical protein
MLALCLDYRSLVTDYHRGLSESIDNMAKKENPSQSAILEAGSAREITDRHAPALLENVLTETDRSQLLPPSTPILPNPHHPPVKAAVADKMILTLPYHAVVATSSPPRSKVLLVEDNIINMKVYYYFPISFEGHANSQRLDSRPLHGESKTRLRDSRQRPRSLSKVPSRSLIIQRDLHGYVTYFQVATSPHCYIN